MHFWELALQDVQDKRKASRDIREFLPFLQWLANKGRAKILLKIYCNERLSKNKAKAKAKAKLILQSCRPFMHGIHNGGGSSIFPG